MNKVTAGYFMRGEDPPIDIDPRYEWVCVRNATIKVPDRVQWCKDRQAEGMKVMLHLAICYADPSYGGEPHDQVHALLGNHGFLLDDKNKRVPNGTPWKLIDMRETEPYGKQLALILANYLTKYEFVPDGLFLDFMWERVEWKTHTDIDDDWKSGMDLFMSRFNYWLAWKGGVNWQNCKLFLNGFHVNVSADGIAYENFPNILWGSDHSVDRTIFGERGVVETSAFFKDNPTLILMKGGNNVAYDIPESVVEESVDLAYEFCTNGAVIFDNSGYVFDILDDDPPEPPLETPLDIKILVSGTVENPTVEIVEE